MLSATADLCRIPIVGQSSSFRNRLKIPTKKRTPPRSLSAGEEGIFSVMSCSCLGYTANIETIFKYQTTFLLNLIKNNSMKVERVCLMACGVLIIFLFFRSNEPNYSGYIKERNEIIDRIEALQSKYDSLTLEIQRTYEIIDTASVATLRDLTRTLTN